MQGSLYGVSYVDWMLHCKSVVIEVGVGSVQFERAWLLRLNRVLVLRTELTYGEMVVKVCQVLACTRSSERTGKLGLCRSP